MAGRVNLHDTIACRVQLSQRCGRMQQVRNVNASCVNNNMVNRVVERRPECFNACPNPSDQVRTHF